MKSQISKKIITGALALTMAITPMLALPTYAAEKNTSNSSQIELNQNEPELINYEIMFSSRSSALVWVRAAFPDAWHFEFFYNSKGEPCVKVYTDREHPYDHFIVRCEMVEDGHCYIEN